MNDCLAEVSAAASDLALLHGRRLSVEVEQTARFDETSDGNSLSRREFFRESWRNVKFRAADVLAPLDPGKDDHGEDAGRSAKGPLPHEIRRRVVSLRAAGLGPGKLVPWRLPRVNEACRAVAKLPIVDASMRLSGASEVRLAGKGN